MNGAQFESEIREQPGVLARIAASGGAAALAAALGSHDVVFTGSGSSLFVAQLAALAWRRSGRRASAVAASEALFTGAVAPGTCVVALSQSGRTGDVLDAVAALAGKPTIVLTNDAGSPLAAGADLAIDIHAAAERAVPASKSVTAMAALLLAAAARAESGTDHIADELAATAALIGSWLDGPADASLETAAELVEPARSIIIVGGGYGVPVADEIALKIKEATYHHAEGFGAGEFRHGSTAVLDASRALIGIVEPWSRAIVGDVIGVAHTARAITAAIGDELPGVATFGPRIAGTFAPLGWIITGQLLALHLARRNGIDSDAPRGLRKFIA